MFKLTCDDLQEWIKEKNNALYDDDVGKDLESSKNLRRKHMVGIICMTQKLNLIKILYVPSSVELFRYFFQNFERELVPVETKMTKMAFLADT